MNIITQQKLFYVFSAVFLDKQTNKQTNFHPRRSAVPSVFVHLKRLDFKEMRPFPYETGKFLRLLPRVFSDSPTLKLLTRSTTRRGKIEIRAIFCYWLIIEFFCLIPLFLIKSIFNFTPHFRFHLVCFSLIYPLFIHPPTHLVCLSVCHGKPENWCCC